MAEQSYSNHAKWDPLFHFVLAPLALINFIIHITAMIRQPGSSEVWPLIMSFAFLLAVYKLRANALAVQDRVIRLEETLRMQRLLPAAMQPDIAKLGRGQFIALRFASDAELPGLVQQALSNHWKTKDIKAAIKTWRPDYFRV